VVEDIDLKDKFVQQEARRTGGRTSRRLRFRKLAVVSAFGVIGVGGAVAFFHGAGLLVAVPEVGLFSGCKPFSSGAASNLSSAAFEAVKQCTPEQAFRLGEARLSGNPQEALMLFEHAARGNYALAARAIGEMYDPQARSSRPSPFSSPDELLALQWYRRADSLGAPGLRDRIRQLEAKPNN
jgi:hypothetical protein